MMPFHTPHAPPHPNIHQSTAIFRSAGKKGITGKETRDSGWKISNALAINTRKKVWAPNNGNDRASLKRAVNKAETTFPAYNRETYADRMA
jgi:hypothetical protein